MGSFHSEVVGRNVCIIELDFVKASSMVVPVKKLLQSATFNSLADLLLHNYFLNGKWLVLTRKTIFETYDIKFHLLSSQLLLLWQQDV